MTSALLAQVEVSVSRVPKLSSIAHQAKIALQHPGTVVIVNLVLTLVVAAKTAQLVSGAQLHHHTA